MVSQALQLQRDAAQGLGAGRLLAAGQGLEHLAVGGGVGDGGVPRQGLGVVEGPLIRAADQRLLDAAVLVAQGNFQMENMLAVTLKTKVARLDDPGMHRANRHLVYLVSLDLIEVTHCGQDGLVRGPPPGIAAGPRAAVTHGLEPGMTNRFEPELLGDLPLEEMHLRAGRGQRGELLAGNLSAAGPQPVPLVVGQHHIELRHPRLSPCRAKKRRHPLPGSHGLEHGPAKVLGLQGWHRLQFDGPAIAQDGQVGRMLSHG